jgi:hypothetical protein
MRCVSSIRSNCPFLLTNYEEAAGWADMIAEVTQLSRMPPWHADPKYGRFANDARLSDDERELFTIWADLGAPEGDLHDLPSPRQFPEAWLIPKPDAVYYMSEYSVAAQATGVVEYHNFVVDHEWRQDRRLAAVEARPDNPSVVHHILVFVIPLSLRYSAWRITAQSSQRRLVCGLLHPRCAASSTHGGVRLSRSGGLKAPL